MKRLPIYLLMLGLLVWGSGCDSTGSERPLGVYEKGVLIINEGAFGANDGEVFHFDPDADVMTGNIFQLANGRPFAGLLQDLVQDGNRTYLVANTGKVEVVASADFISLGAVIEGLDIPRSLVVGNNKLYISDWGPYDSLFNSPESFIAVVNDLNGGSINKIIEVPSRPEGMHVAGDFLYVACGAAQKMEVISIRTDQVAASMDVEGNPVRFDIISGRLFLYARDAENIYFHEIDRNNQNLARTIKIPLEQATSNFSKGEGNQVFVITSSGWPDYRDAVAEISISGSGSVVNAELISGNRFYGIAYEPNTKHIWIADHNGFQGAGLALVYDQSGEQVKFNSVGKGPSGFVFK